MDRGSERLGDMGDRWCILRTSGAKTLPLAEALSAGGFDAWSPRAVSLVAATKRKPASERAAPIVPTFVFVRARQLDDLWRARSLPTSNIPGFHILQLGGRAPEISDLSLSALRVEEARALRIYEAHVAARDAGEARVKRIEQLRTEQARRKALRTEVKAIADGAEVTVTDAPAFAGMVGTIVSGNGRSYVVGFGGMMQWTIEAWQIVPVAICSASSRAA